MGWRPNPLQTVSRTDDVLGEWRSQQDALILWAHRPQALVCHLVGEFRGPIIFISHGYSDFTESVVRACEPFATHRAAVSLKAATAFRGSAESIRNAFDPRRVVPSMTREQARAILKIPDDAPVIAYVGRWSGEKCPLACAQAAREIPGAFAIAGVPGGHGYRDIAMQRMRTIFPGDLSRIDPSDRFRIITDHPAETMVAADVLMMASETEGGPLVVCEAWALGLPVVATPVGIIPEVESERGERLTVRIPVKATPRQLADGVREALACRDELRAAGLAYSATYSAVDMVRAWDTYIENAVAERRDVPAAATSRPGAARMVD